jgi:hypothetical protein
VLVFYLGLQKHKPMQQPINFVPYEQALALKELGFDEPCFAWYHLGDTLLSDITMGYEKTDFLYTQDDMEETQCTAPTYSQAFRWFREKYNIHYAMKPILGSKNGYDSFPMLGWDYDIFVTNRETKNSYYMGYPVGEWFTATLDNFDEGETLSDLNIHPLNYEEAELACLIKLIEIVKTK